MLPVDAEGWTMAQISCVQDKDTWKALSENKYAKKKKTKKKTPKNLQNLLEGHDLKEDKTAALAKLNAFGRLLVAFKAR
jgi:hypothetical protein